MKNILTTGIAALILITVFSCNNTPPKQATPAVKPPTIYKGLYSFGPEVKSFKECASGQEFWAADSSAKLELSYAQLQFEKPYEPVYVEVEGQKVKSGKDGAASEFDSTFVVRKLIKITKDIPKGVCEEAESAKPNTDSKK